MKEGVKARVAADSLSNKSLLLCNLLRFVDCFGFVDVHASIVAGEGEGCKEKTLFLDLATYVLA